MRCRHCDRPIHESNDPSVPWVHDLGGNAYCDVFTPTDAVTLAGTPDRTEAVPPELDEEEEHPAHTECADGCGLAVTHDGACLDKPGGRQVCNHDPHA